jgi:hypothetical protein
MIVPFDLSAAGTSASTAGLAVAVVDAPADVVDEVVAGVDVVAGVEVDGVVAAGVVLTDFDPVELLLPQPATTATHSSASEAVSPLFLRLTIRLLRS